MSGLAAINQGHFDNLFYKLEQTSSSHRYDNGTQNLALDLIKENPIKGYGYASNYFIKFIMKG
ncbi:hypothetical protein [Arsenophonus endosymbiont of Aleurodicus floccissimus]|uniref:hypothetical protein n=1 Tax=Arsenophonus endosymbiont of Aleurodicus floccissimus TaxID=2152761 RepID=UPI0011C40C12|nr:hypothetical protein [Arsenophonus endosymbiont of Aleurodicus floccissimus]